MKRRWFILAIGATIFFLSQLYRTSNAIIAPSLIRDLALDSNGIGIISAAFFYSFALTQIPIILFIDKIGPRKLMTILSVIGIAGAILFSLSEDFVSALAGRILLGIGMSCALMGSLKLLSDWFPPYLFATFSGILMAVGTFGNMMSTTPLAVMVENWGWRTSIQQIAVFHIVATIAFYLIVRDRPGDGNKGTESAASKTAGPAFANLSYLLKAKDYWLISIGTFMRYGTFAALQALWAGPLLLVVLKYSPLQAGNIILAMNFGMIIGSPLWGIISDKFLHTRKWMVVSGLFLTGVATFILSQVREGCAAWTTGLIFFFLGLFPATGQLMYAHIKELFPSSMTGTALTGINFFTMIGSAVFLQGLGVLMQKLYPTASFGPQAFTTSLYLCSICQFLAGFVYIMTREKK
jgi:nitrate/nitrite transporter NarK